MKVMTSLSENKESSYAKSWLYDAILWYLSMLSARLQLSEVVRISYDFPGCVGNFRCSELFGRCSELFGLFLLADLGLAAK